MQTAAFDYDLPTHAIAQVPVEPRDRARLLVDRGKGDAPEHRTVADLPQLVRPGDVMVVNTTRVLPARLKLRKPTGGAVEVFLLERTGPGRWDALVRPSRKVAPGTRIDAGPDLVVEVGGQTDDDGGVRHVVLHTADEQAALARHGAVPLPPYITAELADPERYQTVFADRPDSVAAPTAGLHLTDEVLDGCRAAGATIATVELAVGLGTFKPMVAERVEDHHMHSERYRVPPETLAACRNAAGRVIAVGTTAVRALESAARRQEPEGRTDLFIRRPFDWQVVDVLLTNFHLPRSSLLVLVDAFVGPRWRDLYAEALTRQYRFLSFGDAMLLERDPT
ncbi:MAG TPA: tRNA preQ1(34) S-adenosylmethionine ribosyltransferase-isomerase QueA [Acidimicrobiales bacterium]|nr:tRNA preQ1(34) S-adenosylmethionine ribosyltransferase-isomerase QueA [Acidimicrobiales bacterium]